MKADKTTVTIRVQTLSINSVPKLLHDVAEKIDREVEFGTLIMSDGDQITWTTKREEVTF